MKIYNYDKTTGELLGESTARENPLEPGEYLIPAHATAKEPKAYKEGFVSVFKNNEWTSVEDIRGSWYNIREKVEVNSLDHDMTGLTKEPVPYSAEQIAEQLAEQGRAERDSALRVLDTFVSNPLRYAELTEAHKIEAKVYRQALLDVPQQKDFPQEYVMPEVPDYLI